MKICILCPVSAEPQRQDCCFLNIWKKNPIIDIGKTAAELNLSFNTVANAVKRFVQQGILAQCSNADRYRVFSYEAYLKILRKDT